MNKYFKIICYYLIILLTFIVVLWIIWARFIRERLVKDIPIKLNEYGFWFLVYVCIVYLFISSIILFSIFMIKKNKTAPKTIIKELINQIYIPFIMLDHAIKYNNYFQNSYYNLMLLTIKKLKKFTENEFTFMIVMFQIIPRIFLVGFLVMDTFYFHKLEILYKIILIGLLPFLFRYIKYNFNDFKEHNIKHLDSNYNFVLLLKETPTNLNDDNDENLNHGEDLDNKTVNIKEYIDFKIKQSIYNIPNIIYNETPFAKDEIYNKYNKKNNIISKTSLNDKIYENIREDFKNNTNIICDSAVIYEKISYFQNKPIILYLRVFIYSMYLVCWSYILFVSYYNYPVDLPMFKILIKNVMMYLQQYDMDPFSILNQHSINENLITPDNVCNLIKSILNKIVQIIKNKLS